MIETLSCPSCAAPLPIENRFAKLVTCDFCGHVSVITNGGLDPTGRTAQLAQLPSLFYVDARGTIGGRPFRVLGRLRYQYEGGYWDEWYLTLDGERPGWLVEDEGEYTYYVKKTLTGTVPGYNDVRVGSQVTIDGRPVFVTEKGEATIAGGEGQLAFTILPGEQVRYVDGTSGKELVSIEYYEDEIELSLGRPIRREQIEVEEAF